MVDAVGQDQIVDLELSLIDPPKIAARLWKSPEQMQELMEDLARNGLQVPIEVRPVGERYEVVYGDRRSTCARELGWKTIRAIIRPRSDREALLARFTENQFHDKPNPVEDAYYFRELVDQFHLTEQELCDTVGKTPDFVAKRLRILEMPEYMQDSIAEYKISLGVAYELMKVTDDTQRKAFLYHAIMQEASVRAVKFWVEGWRMNGGVAVTASVPQEQPAEQAPVAPVQLACEICGPVADPYNLTSIMVHRWEVGLFHDAVRKAEARLSGEGE